jgi:hypothetical protein
MVVNEDYMIEGNMARQVDGRKRQRVNKLAVGSAVCGVIAGSLFFIGWLNVFNRTGKLEDVVISILVICTALGLGTGLIAIALFLANRYKERRILAYAVAGVAICVFIFWSMIDVVPKNKIRPSRFGVNEPNQTEQRIGIQDGN